MQSMGDTDMDWKGMRQSSNVEDRRGSGGGGMAIGGGIGGIVIALLVYLLGGDPGIINDVNPAPSTRQAPAGQARATNPEEEELRQFVGAVLGSTEDVWKEQFKKNGETYTDPTLVLFTGQVQSACGMGSAAMGPFYCPPDRKVYIDLSFYRALRQQLGAPGDFAQAYVVAHEVGHHVQNLLGISDQVERAMRSSSKAQANALSVRLELQADFLAGVWAHYAQKAGVLQVGDIEEALNAAAAIGDDKLQSESQGRVVPESFTHGTSEQRARWFRKGLETGDMNQGNTFDANPL
jgi:predicted metalloprotease